MIHCSIYVALLFIYHTNSNQIFLIGVEPFSNMQGLKLRGFWFLEKDSGVSRKTCCMRLKKQTKNPSKIRVKSARNQVKSAKNQRISKNPHKIHVS